MDKGNRNLRRILASCLERCKTHDAFLESVFNAAMVAYEDLDCDHRQALQHIAKLCDPKLVTHIEFDSKLITPEAPKLVEPPKPERSEGIVHGGEELRRKPEGEGT